MSYADTEARIFIALDIFFLMYNRFTFPRLWCILLYDA